MQKTTFKISKMDCPSEEQIIRMKLDGLSNIQSLEFDIPNRSLRVFHTGDHREIFQRLDELNFDTKIIETIAVDNFQPADNQQSERKVLWAVLIINFAFFAIESVAGLLSNSMGLVADSLDMLADAIVYGLALLAVGATVQRKKNVAKFAGYFQIILATIGFVEIVRRFIGVEEMPDFQTMIIVSILALIANVICLYLLLKNKSKEAHIRATVIFSSNDVIINTGVIVAGVLVHYLNSSYPDLIVGA
ncbi:MAG: cation transporter, partial [Bacteroidales bacterium]|nr:cation transporter [Bacteroidales bacterium]